MASGGLMQKLKQLIKWPLVFLLILIPGAPLFMKWMALRKAREHVGQEAPDTSSVDSGQDTPRKVFYFHAPYCGPCKAMMPMSSQLQQEYPGLIKVDATQNPELAQAFGVSATPTFVITDVNRVTEVRIGACGEGWLRKRLANPD